MSYMYVCMYVCIFVSPVAGRIWGWRLAYERQDVTGRREKVRFKMGFKSSKTVRWVDMHRERISIISWRYTQNSRGKRRLSTGKNSKKVTISIVNRDWFVSISKWVSIFFINHQCQTWVHAGKYETEDKSKTDITKLSTAQKSKQHKTQQNKTKLVQSLLTTLGQETRWAYSTTLPSPCTS